MAKQGTASVASGVRSPGAAPSASPDAGASVPAAAPGDASAPAAEALNSLEALSLGPATLERPFDAGVTDPPIGAPSTAETEAASARAVSVSGSGDAVAYDAYGYPAGTAYDAGARFAESPGMYPPMGTPGMPGMAGMMSPEMLSPEMAMQQQHAAMLYHQQTDPAAVYAYYRAAAESGDPRAAEALEAMRGSASDDASASNDASEHTQHAQTPHAGAMDPGAQFVSAEMYAAQMHQLSQMAGTQMHQMHAHAMWGGAHVGGGWEVLNGDQHQLSHHAHQQWQQHAGYARAYGHAHDARTHARQRRNDGALRPGQLSYAYDARGYEGEEGSSGWKPPSLRGARGRRETSRRNGRENARGHHGGHHGTYQKNGGGTNGGSNLHATAYDGTRSRGRRDFRDFRGDATPGSALLEAFKKNAKSREIPSLSLADVAGHVCEFARDQHGSRFIQQRLENAASDEIAAALAEMLPEAVDLASDVFGNYVAQKFFECGDSAARATLSDRLEGHVLKLSLHAYGCRVVQKALETVDEDTKAKLAAELDGNVLRCVRDQNGNHVVQKCVERMETRRLGFIVSALAGHVASLSAHPYGCRVIQRALERCAPYCPSLDADGNVTNANETNEVEASEKTSEKNSVVRFSTLEILRAAGALARDRYGNYVVQHVLQHGDDTSRKSVLATLAGQIVPLAQHKFASNVVEKCLTYCGAEEREIMIGEILGAARTKPVRFGSVAEHAEHTGSNGDASFAVVRGSGPGSGSADTDGPSAPAASSAVAPVPPLHAMMKDQFANYVVQKLLEVCDDAQRERLLASARAHLPAVKKVSYGKHVVARVEKLVVDVNGARGGGKADARGGVEMEDGPAGKGDGEEESGG